VLYTGRLFGYFRYPEVQELHLGSPDSGCDGETPLTKDGEPEAYEFQEFMKSLTPPGRRADVLVSIGDNFAPFLLGRKAMLFKEKVPPELVPKEKYDYDGATWVSLNSPAERGIHPALTQQLRSGNGTIPQDNVGCFLRRMHFNAIVPGKHDFYFGPERLRELARFLAKDDPSCPPGTRSALEPGVGSCPVTMLAANLFIKTQVTGSPEKGPPEYDGPVRAAVPKVVTPWMRRIVVVGVPNSVPSVFLEPKCYKGRIPVKAIGRKGKDQVVYEIPPDAPGLDVNKHQVLSPDCTYLVRLESQQEEIGQFTVSYPFFTNPDPPSSASASQNQPFNSDSLMWPWVEVSLQNAGKLVIFGIVDRDLAASVGRLNYTWLGTEKGQDKVSNDYESVVLVSDPADTLNQVLEYCEQVCECKTAHKLILAQMNETVANQELGLVRKLNADTTPFEVVITDADPDRATGNRRTELTKSEDSSDKTLSRPTVLVPDTHFRTKPAEDISKPAQDTSPYKLLVRLQAATITLAQDSRTVDNKLFVDKPDKVVKADPLGNRSELVCPNGVTDTGPCSQGTTLQAELNRAMHDNKSLFQRLPTVDPADSLKVAQEIALETMRATCHSDVALLQDRDIFSADRDLFRRPVSRAGLEAAVSALFWKGDFVQCLNLSGDTVQTVLKRSEELKNREETGLSTELSNGWWLLRAGVEPAARDLKIPGPAKAWMVNGDFLDAKKLYSVAATDYIANGDTGYPTLQNAEPAPNVPLPMVRIRDLAREVAATLGYGSRATMTAGEALDRLDRSRPKPDVATATTFPVWLGSWTNVNAFSSASTSFDTHQQEYPIFSLKLYRLDFGYSIFQHNGTEGSIPMRFPGVTSVDLSTTANFAYTADYQVRAERTATRFGTYFESDLNFGRNNKRANFTPKVPFCFPGTPDTCYQASQTANYWYQEGGLAVRLTPLHQNPSGLKLILPVGFKTQLVRPYTQVASVLPMPPGATPVTGPAVVSAPRNYYLAFRPGFRYEHSFPRGAASAPSPAKGKPAGPTPGKTFNSYVEAGFETGRVFNSPSVYHFAGLSGPSSSAACPETDGFVPVSALAACLTNVINANTPLDRVIGGRSFGQQGLYLNFRLDMPLPGKTNAEYLLENRGDYFLKRSTDLSVDTRFLDDLSTALLFPVWGGLNIGPTAELIFFKTKGAVPGSYYFSYSTSLALNYSFDWRPGLKRAKAFTYGNSDPAPQPLPSR